MAQIKLLKIDSDGVPVEMNTSADDITLNSFTIQGGGPVLSPTGLNLNTQPITGLTNVTFVAPSSDTINQTAGNLIIDNIMAKERSNVMTTAADILFPVISDVAGQVDAFRVPAMAGVPSATPTVSGAGYLVYDSAEPALYAWTGSAWQDVSLATSAKYIDDSYTAANALTATNAVYISAADNVDKASASAAGTAQLIGFATAGAAASASVTIRKFGKLGGFSSLTPGARYYLSATAGNITSSVPVGIGNTIVQAGYATDATTLDIQIQQLGRRAL